MSDRPAPHVVILGGYLSESANYGRMRSRLLDRGAARVDVAPIHMPDWVGAAGLGFGPLLLRAGRVIRAARRASPGPLIVVGHSTGGLLARLAMAPLAFEGRRAAVADDVGCLVTLGTPHGLRPASARVRHRGHDVTEFLSVVTPGAWFAPRTAYLTLGSSVVRAGMPPRNAWGRLVRRTFRTVLGPIGELGSDGIVPLAIAHLEGARHLTFDDVLHGPIGGPWYGDAAIIDRWWPMAVDLWRGALEARERTAHPPPSAGCRFRAAAG